MAAEAAALDALLQEAEGQALESSSLLSALERQRQRREEALLQFRNSGNTLFFKAVARKGSRLVSVFNGVTEYVIGKPTGGQATATSQVIAGGVRHGQTVRCAEAWDPEATDVVG